MTTVKQAFIKAYGELPEGATCHMQPSYNGFSAMIAWIGENPDDCHSMVSYRYIAGASATKKEWLGWIDSDREFESFSPDISGRPASAFRGFFGKEYDNCLDAEGEK